MNKNVVVILLIVVFVSCKKKEEATTNSSNTGQSVQSVDPSHVYCYMQLWKNWWVTPSPSGGTFHSSSQPHAEAFFTNTPFSDEFIVDTLNGVDAGQVLINGDPLETSGFPNNVYYDNWQTSGNLTAPYNWVVTGSSTVPAFNYTSQSAFPSFSNVFSFPDTVHLNQNLSLNIGTINSDYTDAYIQVGGFYAGKIIINKLGYYSSIINVNSTDLQNNPPSSNVSSIILWLIKKQYKLVDNKTYKIQNVLAFRKDSVVFVP